MICVEDPSWHIVDSLTIITNNANFRNYWSESSEISASTLSMIVEAFAVLLSDLSSMAFLCSKTVYFCHNVINDWSRIFKEPNYFRCWAPSAKVFHERGSPIILRTWFQHHAILRIWRFIRNIRLSWTPTTIPGGDII